MRLKAQCDDATSLPGQFEAKGAVSRAEVGQSRWSDSLAGTSRNSDRSMHSGATFAALHRDTIEYGAGTDQSACPPHVLTYGQCIVTIHFELLSIGLYVFTHACCGNVCMSIV